MTTEMFKLTTKKPHLLKKVTEIFTSIYDAIIEARRLQAAMHTASHLIASNKDFKHFSHGELVKRIMDEDNPTHLDGTPAK